MASADFIVICGIVKLKTLRRLSHDDVVQLFDVVADGVLRDGAALQRNVELENRTNNEPLHDATTDTTPIKGGSIEIAVFT